MLCEWRGFGEESGAVWCQQQDVAGCGVGGRYADCNLGLWRQTFVTGHQSNRAKFKAKL